MPKETTSRGKAKRPIEALPPQNHKTGWKPKKLSQLMAQDPSLWGVAWALLWRIMALLVIIRTIIQIARDFLYSLANIS